MSVRTGVEVRRAAAGGNGAGGRLAAALTIRSATRGDLVPLGFFFDTVLRRDYFLRRGQLEELVTGPHHQVYVAEIDTVLVGVAVTTRGSRLVNTLVHPAYRGLGIGRELVRSSRATEVRAKVNMSSGDPRGFYRSLGFVSTGARNAKGNIELLQLADNRPVGARGRAGRRRGPQRARSGGNGKALVKQQLGK